MDINITNPVTASKIGEVVNASASATPNDTDLVMSVDTSVAKKNTWTQVKAFLKTYFDTIYQAAGSYLTSANITQTITNGVTDKAPSEDAVYDALALKANLTSSLGRKYFAYDNTTYSYTGTTSNTILRTIFIPGNTMGINSTLEVYAAFTKSGTAGIASAIFYLTTDPSNISGGFSIGYNSQGAAILQWGKLLRFTNKNAINVQSVQTISGITPDFYANGSTGRITRNFDFSQDLYLHIYGVLANSADTFGIDQYQAYIDHP